MVNFLVRRWKRALVMMMVIMFVCTLDWRDNAGVSITLNKVFGLNEVVCFST